MATNRTKQTKAERTADARTRARQMQEAQRKKEARRRSTVIWVSVVAVVAVIAIVVGFLMLNGSRSIPTAGASSDRANGQGGVVLTSTTELQEQPADALPDEVDAASVQTPGQAPQGQPDTVPGAEANEGEPAHVIVYADFNCVHCASFETQYGDRLNEWLDAGQITLEYRLLGFLDGAGNSNFSSRAANAALCVADQDPAKYNEFVGTLFGAYQEHGGSGLSDDELIAGAREMGVDIEGCQDSNTYRPMVQYTTAQAQAAGVAGTPTVFVNDQRTAPDQAFVDAVEATIEG